MDAQGNNYWSKSVPISNNRYNYSAMGARLGDRTVTSQIVDGKRYFSSLDAEIYFGDKYIDEIVQVQWAIEQSTLPLYGYNSYTFDDIAVGARQISGMFVINFTKANFMYEVLDGLTAICRSSFNAVEDFGGKLKWDSYFEKEHSAAWDRSFNIRVGYGDYNKKGTQTTSLVLQCVQITGCQQMLGIDGSPIGEVYSFIAKDIRHDGDIPERGYESDLSPDDYTEIDEYFVISITSSDIVQILPGFNEINDVKEYGYKLNLTYQATGGIIESIWAKFKRSDGSSISSSAINIGMGRDNKIGFIIPIEFRAAIDKEFINQKKLGNENNYLLIDFIINYEANDKDKTKGSIHKGDQTIFLSH